MILKTGKNLMKIWLWKPEQLKKDMMAPRAMRQREGRGRHPRPQIGGGVEARARGRRGGTRKFGSGDQLREQPRCPVQSKLGCGKILFFKSHIEPVILQGLFDCRQHTCLVFLAIWFAKFLNSFPSDITVPSLASSFITFVWRSAMTSRNSSTDYWLEKTLGFWAALRDVTCLLLKW